MVLLGCTTNPVTGHPEFVLLSSAQERELGRSSAAEVEAQIGLVRDPARLVQYVGELGRALAAHSPRRDVSYQFAIADMVEPNAFALPGGWIYVSRGALAIANSEDELAGVLGHEIGHVAARHAVQRQTRSVGLSLVTVLGAVVAGAAGGEEAAQAVAQLGQVAGAGLIASYGRDQERQADRIGQTLAAEAGYDPAGLVWFLSTLERETRRAAHGRTRQPSFFDSHPMTAERIATAERLARELARGPAVRITPDRAAFLHLLEGLSVGEDPAGGLFRGERFLHPGFGFVVDFPRGWKTRNGHSAVLAADPEGREALRLDAGEPVADPERAAAAFARSQGVQLESPQRLRIGGFPAFRAYTLLAGSGEPLALHLTWIAHARALFRFTGIAPETRAQAAFRRFDRATESFRPMTEAERSSIRERRLALVAARAGESLAALGARSGNVWSVSETAIANGLHESSALGAGQLVKIAVERPFRRGSGEGRVGSGRAPPIAPRRALRGGHGPAPPDA